MDAQKPYEFDFAISFSGENRQVAERLAKKLVESGARVFYDGFYQARLFGKRMGHEFSKVYGYGTRFFVPIVSADYVAKAWPSYEWTIATLEAKKRKEEFILPLRMDDSILVGLPDRVAYVDLRQDSITKVAAILIEKIVGRVAIDGKEPGEQRLVATFGVHIEELLESENLPADAPTNLGYPFLCDWLVNDLINRLNRTSLAELQLTEDGRNGETLSVRITFNWDQSKQPLEFKGTGWWELLELVPYDHVYGSESTGKHP